MGTVAVHVDTVNDIHNFCYNCTYLQIQFKRYHPVEVCLLEQILSTSLVIISWNLTMLQHRSDMLLVERNLISSMKNLVYKLPLN